MYPFNHLINNANINTQIFYTSGADYQIWRKPTGAKMIHILCIGAGGGGGGGFTRASLSIGSGGGGGGSGAISRMTLDGFLCPDILHILTGSGGNGGAANNAGNNGALSVVSMPFINAFNTNGSILLASGAAVSGGGGAGTAATAGAAGAASTIRLNDTYSTLGVFISIAGQAGIIGGANTATLPTAVVWGTLFISGGSGGGGVTALDATISGGNITAPGSQIFQTIIGGAAGGGNGINGVNEFHKYPISTGGSGGGSGGTVVGGIGGDGGFGSGGGGGGAGTTGGRGGKGGDGIIIITSIS